MTDLQRSILLIIALIVIFGLSYIAYEHMDNSYMIHRPAELDRQEHVVDSLQQVIDKLEQKVIELENGTQSDSLNVE